MCTQVRFVVMGNVFPTEVRLHRKYDLKGSTHGRTAGSRKYTEPDAILKVHCAPHGELAGGHASCHPEHVWQGSALREL